MNGKPMIPSLLALAMAIPLVAAPPTVNSMNTPPQFAHVDNTFRFELAAPLARAAPLFGPDGERCGAGKHWDPQLIYPQTVPGQPARDIEGAVFTVRHGAHTGIWVVTVFDLAAARMQYVSVIPGLLLSVIDVRLTSIDPSRTTVVVTCARTALSPTANDDVNGMGAADRQSGTHWKQAIEECLNPKR